MSLLRSMRTGFRRFGAIFYKRQRDAEFAAELKSHLQLHMEDNVRAGMTPEAARREALLKLGGVEQTKENYRDRRGLPVLGDTFSRFAIRSPHAAQITGLHRGHHPGHCARDRSHHRAIHCRPFHTPHTAAV